ncbi:MAG: antibiotic biosynthesis monooxygenase [Chthoniobacterales bacterium]|nr:antibiotic biosynthesis monooxygenase [Chthoniobacterales bacterium]
MSRIALFIRHKTMPGKRDEVREVWERHMQPLIVRNKSHEAYFYCFDDNDPDSICVYQQYADHESSQAFLKDPGYVAYLKESRLLLAGEPEITAATPVWIKGR